MRYEGVFFFIDGLNFWVFHKKKKKKVGVNSGNVK
jgi:hypothetical protein